MKENIMKQQVLVVLILGLMDDKRSKCLILLLHSFFPYKNTKAHIALKNVPQAQQEPLDAE